VVADSDPEAELRETKDKAEALLPAVGPLDLEEVPTSS
jgi:anthranilate/para-aminobenzoate synthase component I